MADAAIAEFRAARSFGWLWLLAMAVLVLAPLFFVLTPAMRAEDPTGAWVALAVSIPLGAFFLLTMACLPFMRYQLTGSGLVLRCGFLLRYRLPYRMISDVRRATLIPTLWSSMRFPGLALWGVPYPEVGTVYMCAKRMSRDILVITVGKRRYGITPADEQGFLDALLPMLPNAERRG